MSWVLFTHQSRTINSRAMRRIICFCPFSVIYIKAAFFISLNFRKGDGTPECIFVPQCCIAKSLLNCLRKLFFDSFFV